MARSHGRARVATYGVERDADYSARELDFSSDGVRFTLRTPDGTPKPLLLPMSGAHNVENAAGVYAACRSLGLSHDEIARGFASFRGVKRRQEVRAEVAGVMVVDDFAHHPTAVRETIDGIRQRYPERRLWAVFEPRSNTSRRNIHQADYATAFAGADMATLREPEPHDKVPAAEQLDVAQVVATLNAQGVVADSSPDVDTLVRRVSEDALSNDVILVMSNGAFGGFIPKLIAQLEQRFRR
jgi:UDP-N-acetylmuramate: L-alanyl-gamma-D-glutamyl-meso-diaminopimelate ligase